MLFIIFFKGNVNMLNLNDIKPYYQYYLIEKINIDNIKDDDRISEKEKAILSYNKNVLFEYFEFYTNFSENKKLNRCFHLIKGLKYKINNIDFVECEKTFLFNCDDSIFKDARIIGSFNDLEQYELTTGDESMNMKISS